MKNKTWLFPTLALALLGFLIRSPGGAGAQSSESVVLTLQTPPYQVTAGDDGFDRVQVEGFDRFGAPGDPELPGKVYDIAVPPDVVWASLRVEVNGLEAVELPGVYEIAPVPPLATWVEGQQVVDWGENAANIVDGKNKEVYQKDAYFPPFCGVSIARSQMRKWRFVRVVFTPFQYNPITKKLRVVTGLEVRVSFARGPVDQAQARVELSDTVMDDKAAEVLYNYDQAKEWYPSEDLPMGTNGGAGYVIITTNAIVAGSSVLDDFVAHKESNGYVVEVVTEDDYGGLAGQSPNGTAEKIRQWLIDHYLTQQIEYVLLIGDPNPDDPSSDSDPVGDVPMKMCWPRRGAMSYSSYDESPTDYFYADLTGNWDLDGDQYFGEYSDDGGSGGVDWAVEVYVGRIPVYAGSSGWETTLDGILQKMMDYENASDQAWRKAALLPMSFSDASTDGAYLAERMKGDYLNNQGYASYTLYQQVTGSDCDSVFDSDEPLLDRAVRYHWQDTPYGMVTWWAHGGSTSAVIHCGGGTLLSSSDTSYLQDSYPAFVYQCSCSNGYPENINNLGYALLKQGAIGTVSASRVSWYAIGTWSPRRYLADNATIGYYLMQQIAGAERAGKALFDEKSAMGFGWGGSSWMNLMDFNLYGDPSTRILGSGSICNDPHEPNDTPEQAVPIAYGETLNSLDICPQGDVDYYAFTGRAGERVVADVDAQVVGSTLDAYLSLYDSNGVERASNDDHGNLDPYLAYTLPADGTYYLMVQASDHPNKGGPDHFYTLSLSTVAGFPFCDGFETGKLGPGWRTYATDEGRVRVSSSYPYSGTFGVLLDDSTEGSAYSYAALVLTIDLSGQSDVELGFWWRDFGDEDHAADGVFLSDDGGTTWVAATNWTGYHSSFVNEVIDLDAVAAANGLAFNDQFQIKFQFYDDGSIPSDGYAIDQVCVRRPPEIGVSPAWFEERIRLAEGVTRTLTLSNTGDAVLKFVLAEMEGPFTPLEEDRDSLGVAPPTSPYAVAIYNHDTSSDISYWTGFNSNVWSIYRSILENDLEARFDVTVVTDLDSSTLAGFSRLILPDNGVPDECLEAVSDWFTPDKRIIAVDSATCYAAYSGWMWPASAGRNGYAAYWNYSSGSNDQQVLLLDKITENYAVGDILSSAAGDAQMFSAELPADALQLTARQSDPSMIYVASREVPGKGTMVVLGPYASTVVASDLYDLVRDAVAGDIDVPWLSEAPVAGTVKAGSAAPVAITFDASQVDQPGIYRASLRVSSNDPRSPSVNVPLTMTVVTYGVALAPPAAVRSGDPGAAVTYTLQVTNTGTTTDTLDVNAGGYVWPATAAASVGPLAAGDAAILEVGVSIPGGTAGGVTDTATITVTSQGDNARSATAELTTMANVICGVKVTPDTDSRSGERGVTVTYTLQVTNTGNITDTFDVSVSGWMWPTAAPSAVGPLAAGESVDVEVRVDVPASAAGGATDTAIVLLTSRMDNTRSVTSTLTTRLPRFSMFLPLIIK